MIYLEIQCVQYIKYIFLLYFYSLLVSTVCLSLYFKLKTYISNLVHIGLDYDINRIQFTASDYPFWYLQTFHILILGNKKDYYT